MILHPLWTTASSDTIIISIKRRKSPSPERPNPIAADTRYSVLLIHVTPLDDRDQHMAAATTTTITTNQTRKTNNVIVQPFSGAILLLVPQNGRVT